MEIARWVPTDEELARFERWHVENFGVRWGCELPPNGLIDERNLPGPTDPNGWRFHGEVVSWLDAYSDDEARERTARLSGPVVEVVSSLDVR